ncbi:MAG: CcoQ/FixQ family Cbb3-type cytochrome c oxidase assembly chaperone [Flavobacteriales bacterium]|jgi:cytochrome c oxidase cbb3-type subunit 4|nr:CcoQ/FixQ family Cbb3-type cytochrome c oxidase assembly chaperone [Flavobacteriales bacterium]
MLKFIKGHLTSIDHVDLFPVMAFVIFFTLFIGVLLWVRAMRREQVDHMSALPLIDDASNANTNSL